MTAAADTAAIVLAAGYGSRFGGDKQLARLPGGMLLLEQTLGRLQQATGHILLVTRQNLRDPLIQAIPGLEQQARIVVSPDADRGMGHSLAAGIAALAPETQGCLICLGDMPWIKPDTYRLLLDTLRSDGILIPAFEGRSGHPVGFGRRFFDELLQCHGDEGARRVIRQHPAACVTLAVPDEGILLDVDTTADLDQKRPD
ncbi:MAG: nucleotidyltransferase family protein [Pseudohongiellaceae bacterium]